MNIRRLQLQRFFLGSAFGRTDFPRIFILEPPDFFADFLVGFFLLIFVEKSAQKNPPGKSPGKSSKIYTTKILQHISADWPGQVFELAMHRGGQPDHTHLSISWGINSAKTTLTLALLKCLIGFRCRVFNRSPLLFTSLSEGSCDPWSKDCTCTLELFLETMRSKLHLHLSVLRTTDLQPPRPSTEPRNRKSGKCQFWDQKMDSWGVPLGPIKITLRGYLLPPLDKVY